MALEDESPVSVQDGGGSNSNSSGKRKSDESQQQQQQRAKRNRYISIAWYATTLHSSFINSQSPILHTSPYRQQTDAHKQRMQATKDQMQWPDSVSAMRQPRP